MLSDDGAKIVKIIINELDQGLRKMPTEISLKYLEEKTRIRPQNIGMAFDFYIEKPLFAHGVIATKCGNPVRIQLKKVQIKAG